MTNEHEQKKTTPADKSKPAPFAPKKSSPKDFFGAGGNAGKGKPFVMKKKQARKPGM